MTTPFIARQEQFTCEHCAARVEPLQRGSYRNHCPRCLWSKHVDRDGPGDRASTCLGLMEPADVTYSGKKGWSVVHRCVRCGKTMPNALAEDDDSTLLPRRNHD